MDLHKRIVKAWDNMPVGAKTRLQHLGHIQQKTDYILKHPRYQDETTMESLLNAIKQASKDVLSDTKRKDNKVQKA